ncbi:reverse transcriptase domain-containing protein [Tanacetum coccineum]
MPNNVKTYDGTGDLEDHVKIFQAAAHMECWEMPTWCHMFNSTLIGTVRVWFDELPPESIDGYKDLKAAFLAYFMQQKKYVKDPVEIHNIRQRDGETIEDFMKRFKVETGHMKGAPECMRIFGFMHGVNNPELTKRLNEHVPKTMEEMMTATTAFIRGETAAASKKKTHRKNHRTSPSGMFLSGDLTSKVSQGKDGGLTVTIRSTILIPTECATVTTASKEILKEAEVRHENFKVALHPNFPNQEVATGGTLSAKGRMKLCSLLKKNLDIFTWQPSDMTGVPRSVAEHRLNIREGNPPVRQKKRGQTLERARAIQVEVQKLVEARIMREVYYHGWLSNPVMKSTGKLNLSVSTPLSVSWTAYKGYHQIQMAESDEDKTAFHTSHGVYCYTKMPFSLKNVGATYQRLVDKAFDSQVGRNIEVYVDDLVIKSHTDAEMLRYIDETFRTLRKINMKLNPKKCTFGVVEGMFLGYMISPEGIKLCPNKIEAVLRLPSLRTIEEKCIKKSDFHWTPEVEQAFKQLKQHLSELPMLVAPKPKEKLIVYLSASHKAISAVLMIERDTVQTPVYFPRTSVKGQILADFLVEKPDEAPPDTSVVETLQESWTLFTDGSSCVDGSAHIGVRNVHVSVDSKLVSGKEENMIEYLEKAKSLVLVEVLNEKSIQGKEVTTVVEEDRPTCMTPIMEYLKDRTLSNDRKEASKLRIKARQYELLEGVLYRQSFLKPLLRCVGPLQADYVIREIHEGSCNMYAGPRSVVAKAIRLGYYWPTMHRDARDMIRKWIRKGQVSDSRYGLFYKVDRSKSRGDNHRHSGEEVCVGQHSVPLRSSGRNSLGQRHVKRANRRLGEGIKARLGEGNKNWIEELPHVLWAHRTMIKSSHGDTPFSLTYETEAVIPAEIGMPTYRTAVVDVVHNDEELRLNLDLLEERRERATICEAKAKLKMTKYYNARVRGATLRPEDFVYRSNDASHAVDGGKLGPK